MKYLRQLADLLPHTDLYNLYGPTETNVCTYHRVDRFRLAGQERLPIGRACANTEVLAVGDDGQLVERGATGELFVRGPSLTPGYWGDPDKTARALVPNSFAPHLGERLYRTGDLVIARRARRVSVPRPARQPGEEPRLPHRAGRDRGRALRPPGGRGGRVIAVRDEEIGSRLRAVVAVRPEEGPTASALQAHCAGLVPRYMVPETITFDPACRRPRPGRSTAHDWRPRWRPRCVDMHRDARTTIRTFVIERLAPAVGLSSLGDEDDLIDSGVVDSLGIFQLIAFLEERYGVRSATRRSAGELRHARRDRPSRRRRGVADACGCCWR